MAPAVPGDLTTVEGDTSGIWLEFPEGTTEVHVRIALSYTDLDGARRNFDAELSELDFAARVADAEDAWREILGRVRVRGGTDDGHYGNSSSHRAWLRSHRPVSSNNNSLI